MARFQMSIVYAKRKTSLETYSEEFDYTCFVDDRNNIPEIQKTVSEIVDHEIDNSKDEVLFGLATAVIDPTSTIIVDFKNKDHKNVEELIDFILEGERTLH